jgi:hypothetical protein
MTISVISVIRVAMANTIAFCEDFADRESCEWPRTNKGFARSAFRMRASSPAFTLRLAGSKATRGGVAFPKLREIEAEMFPYSRCFASFAGVQ